VFILDEVGYLLLERPDATFSFEGVSRRYEAQKSTIILCSRSYGQWDQVFPDPILATPLVERLLHHATTINISGESIVSGTARRRTTVRLAHVDLGEPVSP